jgi:hypothetical protein
MGTDKRPGSVTIEDTARTASFAVKNGAGHAVATIKVDLDGPFCLDDLAAAVMTAGIPIADVPVGTEYVYPSVARIGNGPIIGWDWRTDLRVFPRRIPAGAVTVSTQSEEGALLGAWGFRPAIMIYIPNVRGVVTGIPEPVVSGPEHAPARSRGRVRLVPR